MPICFKFSGHGIIIYCADSYAFTALLSDVVTIVSSSCLLASVTFASSAFLPFSFSCSSRISYERETQARLPKICSTSSV